ncbi:MAG: DNA-3-methyladenine glycosylase 2 family protein [Gammaproteobacteria bacterium]|jgi:DNA-3-methyladenine glycosylase II
MPTQEQIKGYLLSRDTQLSTVIGLCQYPRSRKNTDIHRALLASIVAQQLSVKAADTIFNRFLDLFENRNPDPKRITRLSVNSLRKVGLSQQKAGYIKNVAAFARQDDGLNYSQLNKMTDEELISYLTQIKGVGRWTVEMLLMFAFDRKDVFSRDDLGIQQAMKQLYSMEHSGRELKNRMLEVAENWRPYRSIVCKYLWQWKSL